MRAKKEIKSKQNIRINTEEKKWPPPKKIKINAEGFERNKKTYKQRNKERSWEKDRKCILKKERKKENGNMKLRK